MGWFSKLPDYITPDIPPDPHVQATWFWRTLVAVDQLFNVCFLNGLPDETISSNAGRQLRHGNKVWWARAVCWFCEKIDRNHCIKSIGR